MTLRSCVLAVLATAALSATAGTALADGTLHLNNGVANYNSFTATGVTGYIGENSGPGSTGSSFQTFCLQANEFFTPSSTITYTGVISTYTLAEGRSNYDPSGPTAPTTGTGRDYLSSTTALLYSTFRAGGNFGGNAPSTSSALTTALQLAIWYSEGELNNGTTTYTSYSTYTGNSAAVAMFNWANTWKNGSLYNVRVLQLFNSDGTNAQDQLTILSPAQLSFVPLPAGAYAGMGTLAGVVGMGYIRRRRQTAV